MSDFSSGSENVPTQTIFRATKPLYLNGGWVKSEITVAATYEKTTRGLLAALKQSGIGDADIWTYSLSIIGEKRTEEFSKKIEDILLILNNRDVQEEIVESVLQKKIVSETVQVILKLVNARESMCMEPIYE